MACVAVCQMNVIAVLKWENTEHPFSFLLTIGYSLYGCLSNLCLGIEAAHSQQFPFSNLFISVIALLYKSCAAWQHPTHQTNFLGQGQVVLV